MKTQIYIIMMSVILFIYLAPGCSGPSQITTQEKLEADLNEPFMAEIKEIAVKRERFFYLWKPIDQEEYERRESDIRYQRDYGDTASKSEDRFEVVPIVLIRF